MNPGNLAFIGALPLVALLACSPAYDPPLTASEGSKARVVIVSKNQKAVFEQLKTASYWCEVEFFPDSTGIPSDPQIEYKEFFEVSSFGEKGGSRYYNWIARLDRKTENTTSVTIYTRYRIYAQRVARWAQGGTSCTR